MDRGGLWTPCCWQSAGVRAASCFGPCPHSGFRCKAPDSRVQVGPPGAGRGGGRCLVPLPPPEDLGPESRVVCPPGTQGLPRGPSQRGADGLMLPVGCCPCTVLSCTVNDRCLPATGLSSCPHRQTWKSEWLAGARGLGEVPPAGPWQPQPSSWLQPPPEDFP